MTPIEIGATAWAVGVPVSIALFGWLDRDLAESAVDADNPSNESWRALAGFALAWPVVLPVVLAMILWDKLPEAVRHALRFQRGPVSGTARALYLLGRRLGR